MSVLITPLPGGDALIMTRKLTVFLRHVRVIRRSETVRTELVAVVDKAKYTFSFDDDQLDNVCEQLFKMDLVYSTQSGKNVIPKVNVVCAYEDHGFHGRTKKFDFEITRETFVKIQEDLMLKYVVKTNSPVKTGVR